MPVRNPLLLLEINEIPWRVVDRFRTDPRFPRFAAFFDSAETYTTHTVDSGTLQPWVTWPSFHRGMPNDEHGIRNVGQDPATFGGVPIWDEFRARGHSVGVFGSLQSWPPKDPGAGGFWVPDTFAQDARCIPSYLEPLQRFNLRLVGENGRVVSSNVSLGRDVLDVALSLPRLGIRPKTLVALARQLLAERRDPTFVARRPIFQGVLFWDVFRKLFDPMRPPALTTFFTNHVAGVMHRYWSHAFPEDFPERDPATPRPHAATMDFAIGLVDEILGEAMAWARRNPSLRVVFATSMGQHAVHHPEFEGYEAAVPALPKLIRAIGVPDGAWQPLLAMVPESALNVSDRSLRQRIAETLRAATTPSGKQLFWVEEIGESLSIMIHTPRLPDIREGIVRLGRVDAPADSPPVAWRFEDAGIAMLKVEVGSAHHQPEGILAVHGDGVSAQDARKPMKASDAKAMLMQLAGL